MKAVLQRVKKAQLSINNKVESQIDSGLVVFLGVHENDTLQKAEALAKKSANLRIFDDGLGKMNFNVMQSGNNVLVVSNFTIYADTSRGNRPNFMYAMKPPLSNQIYLHFANCLKNMGINVKTGVFGEHMVINQVCDGPVNVIVEV